MRSASMPRSLSPAQFLAATFFGLIALGSLLLWLPLSAPAGREVAFVDALFTSTSAVCVTGLIVKDTPVDFSAFGQIVILLLIQAGGLGYMTLSTILAVALGKKLSLHERATLQEALNIDTREELVRFTFAVFRTTLLFELAGAVILTIRWLPEQGLGRATYFAVFHAVSAFNNAGFSLFSDNLVRFRSDVTVNLVISSLVICGGLGFFVLRELRAVRSWAGLSMHTKLVLVVTGILLAGGTTAFFLLEWSNPRTLGSLSVGDKLMAAYFQAVTPRTAGFNTIDTAGLTAASLFVTMALMFIGASPGGTGGGVKTTTFGITVFALWATVRGDREPVVFKRRISAEVVAKAFFISLIAFLTLNLVAGLILIVERSDLLPTLFETTSAFGTVGLSVGRPGSVLSLSGHLSSAGKLLITAMMFVGRVGPLTVAVALAARRERARIRYPEGRVMIG
jgi:trk system potassium uptake protein TrkH